MAGDLVPDDIRGTMGRIGAIVLALLFVAVAASWLYLLASVAGFLGTQKIDLRRAIAVFSFGVAMLSAAIWISSQIGIVKLTREVEKRIWYSLIAGLLSAIVSALATQL